MSYNPSPGLLKTEAIRSSETLLTMWNNPKDGGDNALLRNDGNHLQGHIASQLSRPQATASPKQEPQISYPRMLPRNHHAGQPQIRYSEWDAN